TLAPLRTWQAPFGRLAEKQLTLAAPPLKSVPWQSWQLAKPLSDAGSDLAMTPCCAGSIHPAGCRPAWHMVLLKQPGAVPGGWGGGAGRWVRNLPPAWHWAQAGA